MDNEAIVTKIKRCLELARRGGTEAEMQTAMGKVQILLAKYNLSMSDVEAFGKPEQMEKFSDTVRGVEVWHRTVHNAISKLYFCGYWYSSWDDYSTGKKMRFTSHFIVGKKSNVEIVKNTVDYIIKLGDKLAEQHNKYDMRVRNAFRKGFASRILSRAMDQIDQAKKGKVQDDETGKALIIHPLYVQAQNEFEQWKKDAGIKLTSKRTKIYNEDGYAAGQRAANSVSLSSNGIGHNGSVKQIS